MNTSIEKKLMFLKEGYKTCIDPRAQATGAVDLFEIGFTASDLRPRPKSEEFEAMRYAALTLLRIASGLNSLVLWNNLRDRDKSTYLRKKRLATRTMELRRQGADLEEIVAAMDAINDAVRTMSGTFRSGRFDPVDAEFDNVVEEEPDDESEQESEGDESDEEHYDEAEEEEILFEQKLTFARYKCAALLPYLAKRMREVWLPIRERISKPRKTNARVP